MREHQTENRAVWFSRKGDWALFSNFANSPFELDGRQWASVEHYFQAMKAVDPAEREHIASAASPMAAKTRGRQCRLRADWEMVKDAVMMSALRAKFSQNAACREILVATGSRPLHEDAAYDRYWGGQGLDRLGTLLRQIREEIRLGRL